MGKVLEKVILKIVQRYIEEANLLNASQFDFRPHHSKTLQSMRLADHVKLNFNKNISTAAVFLDIEKALDTTWHPVLLYKLSKLEFSSSMIKLITFFLSKRKLRISEDSVMSTLREMQVWALQVSELSTRLYSMYTNDIPFTRCLSGPLCK
jgi:hypothetical protein